MHASDPLAGRLYRLAERRLEDDLLLLERMVAVNSFTLNREGIRRLGEMTAEAFAPLGFRAAWSPGGLEGGGDHLFLTRAGRAPDALALVSHLDTVFPPEEEQAHGFRWRREGARVYGPGVVDIKGGTVMIRTVLELLRAAAPEVFETVTWHVGLNAAEEQLSKSFPRAARELFGPSTRACLVFEMGEAADGVFRVVDRRKGRFTFALRATGRNAHAGSAHKAGANAIVQLCDAVRRLSAATDYPADLTVNVGRIEGGTGTNVVPNRAAAHGEMRAFDPAALARGRERLLELPGVCAARSEANGFPARTEVEITDETAPLPAQPGTVALAECFREAAGELGLRFACQARGGLSDANHLWRDYPVLDGIGPAGGNLHCSRRADDGSEEPEYMDTDTYAARAALDALALVRIAGRFCGVAAPGA